MMVATDRIARNYHAGAVRPDNVQLNVVATKTRALLSQSCADQTNIGHARLNVRSALGRRAILGSSASLKRSRNTGYNWRHRWKG